MIVYFLIGLTILISTIVADLDVTYFGVSGGAFGVFCSSVVLWSTLFLKKNQKTSSTYLLFWRSLCDFGIGVRFMTGIQWNYWQCGDEFCTLAQKQDCWAPSFILEFFELASEAWFLCVAMDLAVSVTDPFSSPKARLYKYHTLSWSFGLVMALLVSMSKNINGLWWITEEVSDHGFCWIQNHTQASKVNWKPFVFFYIPLLAVYGYASFVMVSAYNRLRLGISKTFQHRVQMLTTNAINVTVYFVYWTVVLLMYALVNDLSFSNPVVAKWLFNILIFTLSAKGFADLIVHLIVFDVRKTALGDEEEEGGMQDFNAALRSEVLHFATTGIRVCAQRAVKSTEGKRKVVLSMTQNDIANTGVQLSPYFFLKLMFGSQAKLDELKAVMIRDSSTAYTAHSRTNDSSRLAPDITSSRPASTRVAVMSDRGGMETTMEEGAVLNPVHTPDMELGASSLTGSDRDTFPVGRSVQASTDEFRFTEMSDRVSSGSSTHSQSESEMARETGVAGASPAVNCADFCCNAIQLLCCGSESRKDAAEVKFTEHEPFYFRLIRQCSGVDDEMFKTAFKNTIKERLTEGGASGAFFFFSMGERFIAKSCTETEMDALISNASKYANYLADNRESFITRIYGAYKLHIYGTDLNFFVMNNIFLTPNNEIINEKYDLKGSWVARNAAPPQEGQRVPCTYCNQTYVYRRSKPKTAKSKKGKDSLGGKSVDLSSDAADKCPFTVLGHHEPNVILKDNDLKHKMRLPSRVSKRILAQIKKDAHFLCSLGVMDYSLLVGVHNTEYAVDDEDGDSRGSGLDQSTVTEALQMGSPGSQDGDRPTLIPNSALRRRNSVRSVVAPGSEAPSRTPDDGPITGRLEVSRVVGPKAYYLGIVDYQQKWDISKQVR